MRPSVDWLVRACRPAVPWVLCAGLMAAAIAPALAPPLPEAAPTIPADQEPISPLPAPPAADPRVLALGESLFADPRLSAGGERSCASCHDIRTNGADGRVRSSVPTGSDLLFNTPTVFNAALSYRLGWEGKFRTLEEQAEASLESPEIMGARVDEVVVRIRKDADLTRQFRSAFGRDPNRADLLDALATYERSLLTSDSLFDRWLRGDTSALSAEELSGYETFKSLGCVSCHQGVNVGANLKQRLGVFRPVSAHRPEILRVPSLRNVATTSPYFHDGSAATLHEAVRRMAKSQLNRTLLDEQIDRLVAFLRTLTGTYQGKPLRPATP
ncbi:Cytochrome c551 peroxidase [Methylobacterium soli]|nr:Cytochrome c551 peroxidase [Methylobacterium soli]